MEEKSKGLEEKMYDINERETEFISKIREQLYTFIESYIIENKDTYLPAAAASLLLEKQGEHDAARAITYALARQFLTHTGIDSKILDKFDPGYSKPEPKSAYKNQSQN